MFRIFGEITRRRFLEVSKLKNGRPSVQAIRTGFGTSKMNKTIKENTSIFTPTLKAILIITAHISGSSSISRTALAASSKKCVMSKTSSTELLVGCIPAFPPISQSTTRTHPSKAWSGCTSQTINSIAQNISRESLTILKESITCSSYMKYWQRLSKKSDVNWHRIILFDRTT